MSAGGHAARCAPASSASYNYLLGAFGVLAIMGYEGIVWHHPDGRMAKLKMLDFAEIPTKTKEPHASSTR